MFVREFENAKEMRKNPSSIVVFTIKLENDKILPIYLVTDLCLLSICEDIFMWRESLLEYCIAEGLSYSCLIGVSYVE
jgi:hypothetical protein